MVELLFFRRTFGDGRCKGGAQGSLSARVERVEHENDPLGGEVVNIDESLDTADKVESDPLVAD